MTGGNIFVVAMIGWISGDVCFIVTGGNGFFSVMIGWISDDVGLL